MSTSVGATLEEVFPFGFSQGMYGYALGAGGEYRILGNWSVKAEYLYVSLTGKGQYVPTTVLGPSALPTDAMSITPKQQLNILRVGLNYKF